MFRPSRPMIRPFMSSEGSSTTATVVSVTTSEASLWTAVASMRRARRSASSPRPDLGVAHQYHGVALGIGLHLLEQFAFGRSDVEVGDPGQRFTRLLTLGLNLYSKLGDFLLAVDEELLALRQVAGSLLEGPLPGCEALLAGLRLDPTHLERCLFTFPVGLGSGMTLFIGFGENPLSLEACRPEHFLGGSRCPSLLRRARHDRRSTRLRIR